MLTKCCKIILVSYFGNCTTSWPSFPTIWDSSDSKNAAVITNVVNNLSACVDGSLIRATRVWVLSAGGAARRRIVLNVRAHLVFSKRLLVAGGGACAHKLVTSLISKLCR